MDLEEYVRGENMSEDRTFIAYQDGAQINDKDRDKDRCEKSNNVQVPVDFYKQVMAGDIAFHTLYRWAMDGESAENIKQQLIGMGGLICELVGTVVING